MSVIDMLELYCTLPAAALTHERGKIENFKYQCSQAWLTKLLIVNCGESVHRQLKKWIYPADKAL